MLCYTCDVSCEASASGDDCKADFVCEENFVWFPHFGSCGAPEPVRVLKEICATSANSPTNNDFCKAYTISNDKITPTNVSAILVLWRSRAHWSA